jgi:periplasmic copper chaperone A
MKCFGYTIKFNEKSSIKGNVMASRIPNLSLYLITVTLFLSIPDRALSHATFTQKHGVAGATIKAALRIGHGCSAGNGQFLPTKKIIMIVPEGVRRFRAYNKSGWKIKMIQGPVTPYESGGNLIMEDTVKVIWRAMSVYDMVPDGLIDEFRFQATLPNKPATSVYFPTVQVCSHEDKIGWVELPENDQEPADLHRPAPRMVTTPSGL